MYQVDKTYCMNSFLALRHVAKDNIAWADNVLPNFVRRDFSKAETVYTSEDIEKSIQRQLKNIDLSKTGIMLSGGMDSAILATFMRGGAPAYSMRTVAEGSVNEVEQAKVYADINGLDLKVVDITWSDYEEFIPILARHKKSPFHSIEPQIYKTLLAAKNDGIETILCGENADVMFGGFDGLLSQEWDFEDFVKRYNFLEPEEILNDYVDVKDIFEPYRCGQGIDAFGFISHVFAEESLNSYLNPAKMLGINLVTPFANMKMGGKIDFERIRNGENKYLIRELFKKRYHGMSPNPKLPMPRAVGVWLKDWFNPVRPEFKKFDINILKPDQKWLVFILEQFLNLLDEGKLND